MSDPYRAASAHGGRELVVRPKDGARGGSRVAALVGGAALVAGLASGILPLAVAGATAITAGTAYSWRRARRGAATLRVEAAQLLVLLPSRRDPVEMPLRALRNVLLETTTVVDAGPAVRPDGTMGRGEPVARDISVIVLAMEGGATLALGGAPMRHSEALEWMRTIRLFLRESGWIPEDERPA